MERLVKGVWKNRKGFNEEMMLGLGEDPDVHLRVAQIGPGAQFGVENLTVTVR